RSIIQTPANDLKSSLEFYTKLNFKVISEKEPAVVSDGKAFLEITTDKFTRAGIKLLSPNWEKIAAELQALTSVVKIENGYLLSEPSGMWIYLIETTDTYDFKSEESSTSVLGNYAGISLETVGDDLSLNILIKLGFKQVGGDTNQGWITVQNDDDLGITVMKPNMCPHLFTNPSLTYFNGGNNEQVIESIRDLNIPITEEITHFNKEGIVDNVIIKDPGGFGFFIFND
ncbi:MAG: hypothetical protein AAFP70_17440, partial [Calditrichota bacterium]